MSSYLQLSFLRLWLRERRPCGIPASAVSAVFTFSCSHFLPWPSLLIYPSTTCWKHSPPVVTFTPDSGFPSLEKAATHPYQTCPPPFPFGCFFPFELLLNHTLVPI